MEILDCRSMKCPQPVIETKKIIESKNLTQIEVLVNDEVARENVSRFARSKGFTVQVKHLEGKGYSVKASQQSPFLSTNENILSSDEGKKSSFVIGSISLGSGPEELGEILMKNFIYTLAELDELPESVLFLNSGVFFTLVGSEVLPTLQEMLTKGTRIASCGLCLDYYKVKEKLAVGEATNIYEIAETLQNNNCNYIS